MSTSREPIKILVTGAAGQIAYSLVFSLAKGDAFGEDQPIILHLLDIAPMLEVLNGVVMELNDGAFPLLVGIVATAELEPAFKEIDYALLVGAMPRREGMERKDLLKANAGIFTQQGVALSKFAKKTVKVLVVGNPANTNALLALTKAEGIPKENFSALTRLDHNRARHQIAHKLNIPVGEVHGVFIWGNHSSTQYPDVNSAYVGNPLRPEKTPVRKAVNDDSWLNNEFVKIVQQRGGEVIKARKLSSAGSAAKAIVDHIHDWAKGTNEIVSMAVYSDGSHYDIPEGLIFSFPVTCSGGTFHIVDGLSVDQPSREKLNITSQELADEKKHAFEFLN